jgi:hypothetical protein
MTWERLAHNDAIIPDLDPAKITGDVHRSLGAVAEVKTRSIFLLKRGCMHQQDHLIRPTNAGSITICA